MTVARRHRYIMLRNSDGDGVTAGRGLTTAQCLDALVDGFERAGEAWHVGFAFGYDVNMILGDLSQRQLRRVHRGAWVQWRRFRLRYRRGKQFTVQRYRAGAWSGGTVWDVFGFFQASFVRACEQYEIGSPHVRAAVQEMKQARATFRRSDLPAIERYCHSECELLVQLMDTLKRYLDEAGLRLGRWDGAGAVAASLLQREGVKQHKCDAPPPVADAVQYAYAGGRIEALQYGHFHGEVHHYDINSAYPAALQSVPCLAHGRWVHRRGDVRAAIGRGAFALFRVRWDAGDRGALHPFFWRAPDGRIFFPARGEGWYWSPEAALLEMWVRRHAGRQVERRQLEEPVRQLRSVAGEQRYRVIESWVWEPACDHQPFAFIPQLFRQRRAWKREGRGAEKVLKLGLNSLYGKCAQHIGGTGDAPPSWHQLEWAGYTTSWTRAQLYRAAMQAPDAIVFLATDGIYSTRPLDLPLGRELGEWEYQRHTGLTVVQSGVYWVEDGDAVRAYHRGFDPDALSREAVLAAWRRGRTTLRSKSTRFIGMGQALAGGAMWGKWRQWVASPRVLQLRPLGTKRMDLPDARPRPAEGLVRTLPYDPALELLDGMSTPAHLPWRAVGGYRLDEDGDDAEDAQL